MATNIFGGLTAAVLALSVWMGFKNNDEFEKQVNHNKKAAIHLKQGQDDLANLTTKRDDTVIVKKDNITENVVRTEVFEKLEKEVAGIESDISSKERTVASNQTKITRNDDVLKGLPDPDVLVPQLTATKNTIAQLKSDIAAEETNLANLKQSEESAKALASSKRVVIEHQTAGRSLPSLSTSVQTVYRNWGFVTLNGGNAQGVVPGSILDVLRGGEVVAKLKVTAVEQNRAAADIILDAVPVPVALRSGDRVVAEKMVQPDQTTQQ